MEQRVETVQPLIEKDKGGVVQLDKEVNEEEEREKGGEEGEGKKEVGEEESLSKVKKESEDEEGDKKMEEEAPPYEEQRNTVKPILQTFRVELDKNYYVVSKKWLDKWKQFVDYSESGWREEEGPGIINNLPLTDQIMIGEKVVRNLKSYSMEGFDHEIIPEQVWDFFFKW